MDRFKFTKEARDFGNPVNENGPVVPVHGVYPRAAERIEGLFEHKDSKLDEIDRELTGNRALADVDLEPINHYPENEHEAAVRACAIEEEFYGADNVSRMYEAIIDSCLDYAPEGPVSLEDMPPLSEFHS